MRHIPWAAIVPAILLATGAWGQSSSTVPTRANEFLIFCQTNFDLCKKRVQTAEIAVNNNLIPGKRVCYAKFVEGDELTRAVLQWLTKHPEAQGQQTGGAVVEALVALYPCKN